MGELGPSTGDDGPSGEAEGAVEELSREECVELLGRRDVGRLTIVVDGQPEVFPVNYALDGDVVVFRTDPGLKLLRGSPARVAFEVDEIDDDGGVAWSVVVKGTAREITEALDVASARERALEIEPFSGAELRHRVRVVPREITGRRLRRPKR